MGLQILGAGIRQGPAQQQQGHDPQAGHVHQIDAAQAAGGGQQGPHQGPAGDAEGVGAADQGEGPGRGQGGAAQGHRQLDGRPVEPQGDAQQQLAHQIAPESLAPRSTASPSRATAAPINTGTEQFTRRSRRVPQPRRARLPATAAMAMPPVTLPALKASWWNTIGVR
jgi:hypothetical protein